MFNEVSWFQDKILMVSGRSHEALDLGSRRQGPTHWRFTTIENPENKPRELIIWIQIWRIYYNRNPNYNKKFPKFASKLMILLPSNAEGLRLPAATEKKRPAMDLDLSVGQEFGHIQIGEIPHPIITQPPGTPGTDPVHRELHLAGRCAKDVALVQSIYPLVI